MGGEKTRGEKMKVSSIMLLKTNGGKMSESGLSIMFMKMQALIRIHIQDDRLFSICFRYSSRSCSDRPKEEIHRGLRGKL
jgi:hypothetical protein